MPSTYVKKNGVAQRLAGIPQGWNVVNTFNVASTAWVANSDSTTSTDYPYVATISTTYFSNDSQPIWQMNGVGSLPTETEREAINMILEAVFTSTGVTLYATDQPAVNLVLETGGFATSYASGTTSAADVTYSNTSSGLTATNVQAAIDETVTYSSSEHVVGKWIDGRTLYRKAYSGNTNQTATFVIDASLKTGVVIPIKYEGAIKYAGSSWQPFVNTFSGSAISAWPVINDSTGLNMIIQNLTINGYILAVYYVKE